MRNKQVIAMSGVLLGWSVRRSVGSVVNFQACAVNTVNLCGMNFE